MATRKALLVGSSTRLKAFAGILAAESFEVRRPEQTTCADVPRLTARAHYDLLLVDLNLPHASGARLVEQLQKRGDVPLMLVGDLQRFKLHERELEPLLAQPGVDWITTPVGDVEFGWRVNKVAPRPVPRMASWTVPGLRSDDSGRLDAARVAAHFGWSLTELSAALGRSVQAVHKTPDAPALQKRLERLERAALLAGRLVSPEPSALRKWLNTPSPDLDEEKPGKLLLEKPGVVVDWLEDAASGHPA